MQSKNQDVLKGEYSNDMLWIPDLEPVKRSREFNASNPAVRSRVVYEYIFNSKTHRWIDENIIGLNSTESRGYQTMGILHYIGLKDKHKGIFKGYSMNDAIGVLQKQHSNFAMVIDCLESLNIEGKSMKDLNEFDQKLFQQGLHNKKYIIGNKTIYYIITVKIEPDVVSPNFLSKYLVYLLEDDKVLKHVDIQSGVTKQLLTLAKKEGIKLLHQQNPMVKIEDVTMIHYKQGRINTNDWQKDSVEVITDLFEEFQESLNSSILKTSINDIDSEHSEEDDYYNDGATIYYYGRRYERNPKNRAKTIEIHGFNCAGCGFNFEKRYGERGKDFIEVHHIKPLSTIQEEVAINPATDLVPVCSNCHRMIHRKKDEVLTIEELKELIKKLEKY
ncbi:HNH endonuclease [Peribacillus sp. NPDC097197]|uniref:HNH endonuclease n=1 Tax=Peribacillus sp. NPDC097197 TaxID=3390615 RepID=UPI003D05CD5E